MNGRCLCGHVSFTLRETPEGVVICRCADCRRWSGNAWASVSVRLEALEVRGAPVWFRSSAYARRGFCGGCGASLFWQPVTEDTAGGERIAVSAGALDLPTGVSVLREEGEAADFQQAGPLPAEPLPKRLAAGVRIAVPTPERAAAVRARLVTGQAAVALRSGIDRLALDRITAGLKE